MRQVPGTTFCRCVMLVSSCIHCAHNSTKLGKSVIRAEPRLSIWLYLISVLHSVYCAMLAVMKGSRNVRTDVSPRIRGSQKLHSFKYTYFALIILEGQQYEAAQL